MATTPTATANTPTYQIKDWNDHFEGSKSRTYKNKTTTQLPSKHGLGYRRLVKHKDGAAIFGAWCSLCQVLSRHPLTRNGYCTHDGSKDGQPYTPDDLELLTDIPAKYFKALFEHASSQAVDWLGVTRALPSQGTTGIPSGTEVPSDLDLDLDSDLDSKPPAAPAKKKLTNEEKAQLIYAQYPRKVGKANAITAIVKAINGGADPRVLLRAVKAYSSAVNKWPDDQRHFAPHPATWFNQARWEDDPAEWAAQGGNPKAKNGEDFVLYEATT